MEEEEEAEAEVTVGATGPTVDVSTASAMIASVSPLPSSSDVVFHLPALPGADAVNVARSVLGVASATAAAEVAVSASAYSEGRRRRVGEGIPPLVAAVLLMLTRAARECGGVRGGMPGAPMLLRPPSPSRPNSDPSPMESCDEVIGG